MAANKDYYKLLELPRTANQEEIKKSYHRLAKKFHPDKNPNNPDSVEKFKAIKEAYETLSDPVKKSDYDNSSKKPQKFTPTSNQARYQTSNFPNFFSTSASPGPNPTRTTGPRIFTFNIYGNTGSPFADILKMFFGGMSDFGPGADFPSEPPRRTAQNPNAAALCQFCRQLFTVEQLIQHQPNCPRKPSSPADFEKMFPNYPGMPSHKPHDWRQQHKDTLESIRRDRERTGGSSQKPWSDQFSDQMNFDYEFHKSGLVQCPSCNRSFNMEAASHHIPHCRQKANESHFQHNTPSNDPKHARDDSFHRAKEYAKNLKKNQQDGNNNQWEYFDVFWDSDHGRSLFSDGSSSRSDSDEEDSYFRFTNDTFSNLFTTRNVRKSTLPDISFTSRKQSFSDKSRRNSSNDIYGSARSAYSGRHQQDPQRSSRGCNDCIRVYGFEAAKIHCSCGFKRSTNTKHH